MNNNDADDDGDDVVFVINILWESTSKRQKEKTWKWMRRRDGTPHSAFDWTNNAELIIKIVF